MCFQLLWIQKPAMIVISVRSDGHLLGNCRVGELGDTNIILVLLDIACPLHFRLWRLLELGVFGRCYAWWLGASKVLFDSTHPILISPAALLSALRPENCFV